MMVDMISSLGENVYPVNVPPTQTMPSSSNQNPETPCTKTTCSIISEDTPVILDHNYSIKCTRPNELDLGLNTTENNPIILNIDTNTPQIADYEIENLNDVFGLNETPLSLPLNDSSIEVELELDYFDNVTLIENLNLSNSDQLEENFHPTSAASRPTIVANEELGLISENTGHEKDLVNVDDEEQLSDDNKQNKQIGPIDENTGLETGHVNVEVGEQLLSDDNNQNTLNQAEPADEEPGVQQISDKKRKKRHQVNPTTWNVNKWKENRKLGKEYMGRKKTELNGKSHFTVKKPPRAMKPRCNCKRKDTSLLQCSTLTEDDREKNFDEFWKLDSWSAKKVFVQFLTKHSNTARARDRKEDNKSRRKSSNQYYLKKGANIVRVCKPMFLHTLSIGEWSALNWQKGNDLPETDEENEPDPDLPASKKLRKPKEMVELEAFLLACRRLSHTTVGRGHQNYILSLFGVLNKSCTPSIRRTGVQRETSLHSLYVRS